MCSQQQPSQEYYILPLPDIITKGWRRGPRIAGKQSTQYAEYLDKILMKVSVRKQGD